MDDQAFQAGVLHEKSDSFKLAFHKSFFDSCFGMESLGELTLSTVTTLEESFPTVEKVSNSSRELPIKEEGNSEEAPSSASHVDQKN